ncbi:hypothetical protein W97_01096 [Coniosporium apollinis CBS 100218]|uniref:Carbohydrate-binding module family 19 domain-containing protein n=1 Tax=Coniosporium apollinis (strain CBS 100218) TaxID=1168221 RepID=R7YJ12_CONA1|nr:uncharacterized protein W97_01096 [Coniosporium apollinis CBS 100218]EON61878.1 hypothetical protein W97_01096 [Coniosporium apollinis CBS 100218]
MHFFTSVFVATCVLSVASAVPTLTERSSAQCPGMSHLKPEHGCSSGFVGCVEYAKASEVCNGPKRFYNDCSALPGSGSFYRCASNGFIGCTTNANICATSSAPPSNPPPTTGNAPTSPPAAGWSCPPGTWYAKKSECPSGFVGCTSQSPQVCDNGPQRYFGSCPPNHGNYYNCANGFVGCTTNTAICG